MLYKVLKPPGHTDERKRKRNNLALGLETTADVNIRYLTKLHSQFVRPRENINIFITIFCLILIMSEYPLKWKPDDLKPPPKTNWSIAFDIGRLDDENFRRKTERRHPGIRWDTENLNDDNVSHFWWVGVPHPDYPKFLYHQRRSEAKKWFPPVTTESDKALKSEYIRLTGEAVLALQRRDGPFASNENIWGSPEDKEARAIFHKMAQRIKDRAYL